MFAVVLAGVNANDDESVAELLFELLEVGDDVLTVDAAKSPEIEDDHLAAQARDREWLADVEPGVTAGKLRSGDSAGERFVRDGQTCFVG